MYINEKHKEIIKNRGYEYIGSYNRKEITIDGKNKKHNATYVRAKCLYCNTEYDVDIQSFKQGDNCTKCCNRYENSFAYHIEKELNEPLDKFWDWDRNIVNPYYISKYSHQKVWIKCTEKDYHGSYEVSGANFYNGSRCPYCSNYHGKVHPKDSFGALHPEKAKYWSRKNKKSPYEVASGSINKYWFYCEDCGSEFESNLNSITSNCRSMKCLNCNSSKGEQKINKYLKKHNINFIPQKEFEGLIGLGNGNLSYDFYLLDLNLLIEFQGIQHEKFTKGLHNSKEDFKKQQEHDRRKKQYAIDHHIDLLEIWYWDYDNIENILNNKIK